MSETLDRIVDLVRLGEVRIAAHGYDEIAEDGILAGEVVVRVTRDQPVQAQPPQVVRDPALPMMSSSAGESEQLDVLQCRRSATGATDATTSEGGEATGTARPGWLHTRRASGVPVVVLSRITLPDIAVQDSARSANHDRTVPEVARVYSRYGSLAAHHS